MKTQSEIPAIVTERLFPSGERLSLLDRHEIVESLDPWYLRRRYKKKYKNFHSVKHQLVGSKVHIIICLKK